MINSERIKNAFDRWCEIVGSDYAFFDEATLDNYSRTTLPTVVRPKAVLCPSCTNEVVALVLVAQEHNIALYPISRGKNWGYGDACAVTPDQVIVDLSRMNQILEVNEKFGYVVLEPGVTQGQLSNFLKKNEIKLWMDSTGAGPDASIVGNALERGFGHTPHADHYSTISAMEVVLSNGQVLNTGFGHYANAKSRHVFPNGLGPALNGIFTQSNLGIVTKMTIWLMPEPECFNAFFFSVKNHNDIGAIIDVLQPLRLKGILQSAIHLGNDVRVISGNKSVRLELEPTLVLSDDIRNKLRRRTGIGAWSAAGGLYGTKKQVSEARALLRSVLQGLVIELRFVDDNKLANWERLGYWLRFSNWGKKLNYRLILIKPIYELLKGIPDRATLSGAYWKKRGGVAQPNDPAKDGCGFLWLSPVLPMSGEEVSNFLFLVEPIYKRNKFDFMITLSMVSGRALCAVMTIAYDKEIDEEGKRAMICYKELYDTVVNAGYIPYRIGIQSMQDLKNGSEVFWDFINQLKNAVDSANIIAPGRYDPDVSKKAFDQ